jgi:hypothetical protein
LIGDDIYSGWNHHGARYALTGPLAGQPLAVAAAWIASVRVAESRDRPETARGASYVLASAQRKSANFL